MKRIKLFNSLVVALTATTPLSLITSCGSSTTPTNNYDYLLPILKNSTIEQFKGIIPIPRPTNHLAKIRTYLTNLAQSYGYEVQRDTYGSIWFDIPANDDNYKNYPKIILQGHMDMVFAFDKTKFPDGDPDPIEYKIEVDETIDSSGRPIIQTKDNKTSLGGDNGIGVAIALAIAFNKDIKHGPLRILITADEESGIRGSSELDPIALDSDYLINLDGGPQYVITTGAKGATQCVYSKTIGMTPISTIPSGKYLYEVDISGLAGGHSGVYILDGRANALYEANKILTDESINTKENNLRLVSWTNPGVTAPTSIIPNNELIFMSDNDISTQLTKLCADRQTEIRKVAADAEAKVELHEITTLGSASLSYISKEDTDLITKLVSDLGYGVTEWEAVSSQNVGPFTWDQDFDTKKVSITLKTYSRTNSDDMIDQFTSENETKAKACSFDFNNLTKYYPWHENEQDKITQVLQAGWKSFDHESLTIVSPAGLEPTWFKRKRPTINVASIGANLKDCHKYTETLYVDSLDCVLQVLLYTIDHINEYK